jgi:hypothetical protein
MACPAEIHIASVNCFWNTYHSESSIFNILDYLLLLRYYSIFLMVQIFSITVIKYGFRHLIDKWSFEGFVHATILFGNNPGENPIHCLDIAGIYSARFPFWRIGGQEGYGRVEGVDVPFRSVRSVCLKPWLGQSRTLMKTFSGNGLLVASNKISILQKKFIVTYFVTFKDDRQGSWFNIFNQG